LSPRVSKTIGLALIALACLVAFGPAVGISLPSLPSVVAPQAQDLAIAYVRESSKTTPEVARLITDIRDGDVKKYIAAQGHAIQVFDLDDKDEHGQPAKGVVELREALKGVELPAVVLLDSKSQRVIAAKPVPLTATGADFISILKGAGG